VDNLETIVEPIPNATKQLITDRIIKKGFSIKLAKNVVRITNDEKAI
jgi:hypothetical protein